MAGCEAGCVAGSRCFCGLPPASEFSFETVAGGATIPGRGSCTAAGMTLVCGSASGEFIRASLAGSRVGLSGLRISSLYGSRRENVSDTMFSGVLGPARMTTLNSLRSISPSLFVSAVAIISRMVLSSMVEPYD